mmetsp:Transcript_24033/g.54657  ORF Transcript_24033/g.54657 Transcript_24033/m.54657 type:complete len:163 (+) Transcript_24033:1060-1548(+)
MTLKYFPMLKVVISKSVKVLTEMKIWYQLIKKVSIWPKRTMLKNRSKELKTVVIVINKKRSASPKRSKISPGELYDMKTVDGNVVHQTNSIWDHIGDDDFCTDDSERSVNLSPNVKTRTSGNESKQTLNCGLTKAQHSMSTSIFCGMEGGDFIGLSDEDNDD